MDALPVLYSFRRCPYAMRARLALAASGQACELREVALRDKPAALLAASPKATVPVLVLPGRVIEQSLDIMRWALQRHDPYGWLAALHGGYLSGPRACLADMAIAPFVRQFAGIDPARWETSALPLLRGWLARWQGCALFERVMHKYDAWRPGAVPALFPPD